MMVKFQNDKLHIKREILDKKLSEKIGFKNIFSWN